jgi:hypothetical protein
MNNFVKIIKEKTGLSITEFCENELSSGYPAFAHRVKKGRLTPAEIFYIVYRTKTSVNELFGSDLPELLVNGSEGGFPEKVKNIIKTLSENEQRSFASLIGLNPTGIKKKDQPELPFLPGEESALDRLFRNTY